MKSIKGSSQLIKLLLIALAYIAILGLAWWFLTQNQNSSSGKVENTIPIINRTNEQNSINQNGPRVTDRVNNPKTNNDSGITIPLNSRSTEDENKFNVQREADARVDWRAKISYPRDGAVVKSDDGWVRAQGSIKPINPGETLFLVVESTTQDPPTIYLQTELRPTTDGFWNANVKYGSLGYEYYTYVISAINQNAAAEVKNIANFKVLPLGVKRISKKYLNLIK